VSRAAADRRLGLWLAAPAFLAMTVVTGYPLGRAVWSSLFRDRLTDPAGRTFVGLRNYRTILADPLWWQDVGTTSIIAVSSVAIELVLGFVVAYAMLRVVRGRAGLRTAVLIPYGVVTVVSAFAWRYAFAPDAGFVNGWLGLGEFAWFGSRWSSLLVILLAEVWKTTPFVALLLLAGLVQVPGELYEAATIDGATAWQRLWRVTIPTMRGAILVAVLFRTLDAWRIFDTVFVMTAGANRTETLSFLAYRQTVTLQNLGLGSAVSVLLFVSAAAIAGLFLAAFRSTLSTVREGR
jgi:multiple sugar transport system permease protein